MTWNHRVFRWTEADGSYWYDIRETHYDEAGNPNGVTSTNVAAGSETLLGLADELSRMGAACSKPVLRFNGEKIEEVPFKELWKEGVDGMMGLEIKPLIQDGPK